MKIVPPAVYSLDAEVGSDPRVNFCGEGEMEKLVLVINETDNVAVALQDIAAGAVLALPDGGEFRAATGIPCGHKVALRAFLEGDPVIKYGEAIGRSSRDIARGEWVHTHNIEALEVKS